MKSVLLEMFLVAKLNNKKRPLSSHLIVHLVMLVALMTTSFSRWSFLICHLNVKSFISILSVRFVI